MGPESTVAQVPTLTPETPTVSAADLVEQARTHYDNTQYEDALPLLDRAIGALISSPSTDSTASRLLALAYELRARARWGTGDREGTRRDFAALFAVSPGHVLPDGVAPAVVAVFNEVRLATVGEIVVSLQSPPQAALTLDGKPILPNVAQPAIAGVHRLRATRPGYASREEDVEALPGGTRTVFVSLDRVAATLTVLTSPADVEVSVDGIARGRTRAGPPPEAYRDVVETLNVPPEQVSQPLLVDDISTGIRLLRFKRPCYTAREQKYTIAAADDYLVSAALDRAVAAVAIETPSAGARVLLDGAVKGQAPLTLADVCEGQHTIELVTGYGRAVRRLDVQARDQVVVCDEVRPAFAILSSTGQPEGVRGAEDLRLQIERLLGRLKTLTVFAPPADRARDALRQRQLADGWLALDRLGRPLDPAAAALTVAARRDDGTALARAFDVQGVASVTLLPRPDPHVALALLAAGSGIADVVLVPVADAAARQEVLERLDVRSAPFERTLGVVAIDVVDHDAPVVARVLLGGAAGAAGIRTGESIVAVNGTRVQDAAALASALAPLPSGARVKVNVASRTGPAREVTVEVAVSPHLVSLTDTTTLFNMLAADLRFRLATMADPAEEAWLRLNHAVALMHVGNHAEARRELQRLRLPEGPGISNGTVQYLLGLCDEALDQAAEAHAAFTSASQATGAVLTEDGPLVSDLASRKLRPR